jgi:putative lipase involved disintegration of autophagic bodies
MTAEQFISDTLEVTHYLRHRFGKDKIYLMGHSGGTFFGIQAAARAPELDIPVYFFEGVYDYTCSYKVAKSYFEVLKAPLKGFYTFEQSAHSPVFEESAKALKILREDVLTGTNRLADAM